jgi:beta-galactosidase
LITDNHILFGASYYPHHYQTCTWEKDLDCMVQAGVNALRVGDFAWVRLQPEASRWEFAWLDNFLDLAHRKGISSLLIPPLRCAPAWLVEQDPTIQIVNESGVRLEFGSRYTFCINHPLLREQGLELTRRIAQRYATHPAVVGWHLDNEYGDEPDCHCDICKRKWHAWLESRYRNIAELNHAWGTVFWGLEFQKFAQIPTPRLTKTYHHPALLQAWRQFRSDCTVEMVGLQADAVRQYETQLPITTNLQSLWNLRTDYYDMARHLDVVGVNFYPAFGKGSRDSTLGLAVTRGCLHKNFHLHELRNGPHAVPGRIANTPEPGEVERLTLQCIGHGADAIFYFQWRGVPFGPEQSHGTPTGYDGRPNRVYDEVQKVGLQLKRIAPLLQNSRVDSEIAVLYDFPTRWSMQGGEEWVGPPSLYLNHTKDVYNSIRSLGLNCDAVGRNSDWSNYKILVAPLFNCMDDDVVERLREFVADGGILIWHPLSGTKNTETEIYPSRLHPRIEELLGLHLGDFATASSGEAIPFQWHGREYSGQWFCEVPQLAGACSESIFTGGWLKNSSAISSNAFGSGRAIYVSTLPGPEFYCDFLADLCRRMALHLPLGDIPPDEIEVIGRTLSDGRRLIFLLNTSPTLQSLTLSCPTRDIWNEEDLADSITFAPWQVRICLVSAL